MLDAHSGIASMPDYCATTGEVRCGQHRHLKNWRAQSGDLRTFLADFVAAVQQFDHRTAFSV